MDYAIVDQPDFEYIDGRAYQKVSPKKTHAVVQGRCLVILERCSGDRGLAGTEWTFHLTETTTLQPDVSFVSYERLDALTDDEQQEPPFAPDVAIEVRSPSYRPGLAAEKIRLYLAHGAKSILDVDPEDRTIKAYANGVHQLFQSGERFEMPQVPWLTFDVSEIFKSLDRPRR